MIDEDLIRATITSILRPRDAFADLFAEQTSIAVCEVADGEVRDMQLRSRQGVGLRRGDAERMHHVHTNGLQEAELHTLTQALHNGAVSRPLDQHSQEACDNDLAVEELLRIAQEAEAEAQQHYGDTLKTHVTTRAVRQMVQIGRSDGQIVYEERNYTSIHIDAIVRRDRKVRSSQRVVGVSHIADLCQNDLHRRLAREAAQSAINRLDAIAPPTGEMTIILGAGGPATLFHEACGHALEADLAHHPGSAYHSLLDTQVAAPMVTLIDDPLAFGQSPVYTVDDEGEPARPTILIDQGVLRSYLYDRHRAYQVGRHSNGHGRRLSYAYPPLPRMSATYLAPGESSPKEMIEETRRGILVQSITGGDTDMGSGRFNLRVGEGYLIENGQLTAPIQGAMLSGRGLDVLKAIDRVGNDLTLLSHCYTCNKLGQFPLLVSVGQPTVRISQMAVWGG